MCYMCGPCVNVRVDHVLYVRVDHICEGDHVLYVRVDHVLYVRV